MTRRPLLPILVLCAAALFASGCGEDSSTPSKEPADRASSSSEGEDTGTSDASASQAELDEVMAAYASDIDLLDDAYPEDVDDDDLAAVIDAFEDALASADGVDDVERVPGWRDSEPLPCGTKEQPHHAVIAQGVDKDFFIGRASRGWIAGFAESSDGDLGTVVARCEDGSSGELHLVGTPGSGIEEERVSAASFDPSTAELRQALKDRSREEPTATDTPLPKGWDLEDSIECGSGDEFERVRSVEGSELTVAGLVAEDAVAIVTHDPDGELAALIATCVDGTARDFRQIARPLDEALEAAG